MVRAAASIPPRAAPDIPSELRRLIRQHFEGRSPAPFVAGSSRIPLIVPSFGWEEVWEALDSLLTGQVTMGEKVRQFEAMFARYIGVKHAIMVNSGSSANLLALSILTNPALPAHLQPGDEVITPAITWATTVWPILNVGLTPALVDVDLDTFNISPAEVERAITPRTRAILPVHLLGNPGPMAELMALARRHNLLVIEDTCEAHGAISGGRKAGSFGDMATFSFFFSHHITTIEGGVVVTDNDEYAELARAMRVFGWVRDLKDRDALAGEHAGIDPRFLFVHTGYNMRPTEIQGGFGIRQMPKLEGFIEARRQNAAYWDRQFAPLPHIRVQREAADTRHVWFGYPMTVLPGAPFDREELVAHLEARGVETRPIMAGNIEEQPAMRRVAHRTVGDLPNARLIHRNAFFFGNHQGIDAAQREAIAGWVTEFVQRKS